MAFIETPRFPDDIAVGSRGGPEFKTRVSVTQAGYEDRNILWTQTRHSYNVIYGVKTEVDFDELLEFFMAMKGRGHEFRFKDHKDFKSSAADTDTAATDQSIGTGDGTTATFQLVKNYTKGTQTYQRDIKKPVSSTVLISIDDVQYSSGWSVDTTTGVVTFDNITKTITNATSADPIVITATGHGLVTGDSVSLSTFTGDWAALNGNRYPVTKLSDNTFSIPVDGTGYTAYSSNGGQLDTLPQTGETIKAGYEFDVPVRFDIDHLDITWADAELNLADVPIVEVRL